MKSNSIDFQNQKNMIKPVKVNLINNIPKSKTKKNKKVHKLIKYNTSNNPININIKNHFKNYGTISNTDNANFIKNISNYISFNKSILLSAYEESLLILFDSLKSYMKNDLLFFNSLKETFIKNVQNFYQKNKNNFSFFSKDNKNKSKIKNEEIKIDNYASYKTNLNNNKIISNSNSAFHKKNKSHINKSISKIISALSNNAINKSNISNHNSKKNNEILKNKIINNKKSLYSLIKGNNKPLLSNSPIKNIIKNNYKYSILKNFVGLNKKIKRNLTAKNGSTKKTENINNGGDVNDKNKEEQNLYKDFSIDINYLGKKNDNNYINVNNTNNNFYYNNIISQMPNKINNNEKYNMNDDLIACIKNSLDENLKGIFDFSYESFLNKESEREGN